MKKKIIAAIVAVVVAHVGVLWAVSHMKMMELRPIEKKPLKVKFLKIKEDVPPPPPPPAKIEPIKPKPIKKKLEPIPVEKPKIISHEVEKKESKVIQQDDTQEKLKKQQDLEKLRLEQLQREQALKDQQAREQALKDQQAREQALREQQEREQASQNQPRPVNIGDISWSRKPIISQAQVSRYFKAEDGEITITLDISSDGIGKVTNVKVTKSSGNAKFDAYVVKQTYAAKFKPYKVNGVITPFTAPQPFSANVVEK